MTRVLLTGASGFVGRHVLAALASEGIEVHAISTRAVGSADHGLQNVTWHRTNLLDPRQSKRVMRAVEPEVLIHLAWFTSPPAYWRSPENLKWVGASLELVSAFAKYGGRRVVAAGSCAEYDCRFRYCVERKTPLVPGTLYGTAKAAVGSILESFGNEAGISISWARLFFLLGPHEHPSRLVPSLVRDLAAGKTARCLSGRLIRDFLHVADAASAIVALCKSPVSGPVNIASGQPTSIGDMAEAVANRIGRRELLKIEPGDSPCDYLVGSTKRLREEVGWRPARSLETAVADTVDWWASQGMLSGPRFGQ